MENEQKPSYEEVVNMYNALLIKLNQMQMDKTNERIKLLMEVFETDATGSYKLPDSIRSLAEYHLKQVLAKPKKDGK